MVQRQNELIDLTRKMASQLEGVGLTLKSAEGAEQRMKAAEWPVPVIGAFSAGKSTLLNTFMGRQVLPTGLAPETDLATELHFGAGERLEAVHENGVDTFSVEEVQDIRSQPQNYRYLRLILNNEALKGIQPLVLVDMPGFDSSLESHQKAINAYVDRGVHYLVITSVEEGTLTSSLKRQLGDIQTMDGGFSLFLNKCDLKPESSVDNIARQIEEEIGDIATDYRGVFRVSRVSPKALCDELHSLDPGAIFDAQFKPAVVSLVSEALSLLKGEMAALQRSKEANEKKVNDIRRALDELVANRDQIIANARKHGSPEAVDRCVEDAIEAVAASSDSLARKAMGKNQEGLQREVVEIVRSSLLASVKAEIRTVSESASKELADIAETVQIGKDIGAYEIPPEILEKGQELAGKVQDTMQRGVQVLAAKAGAHVVLRGAAGGVAVGAGIVAPIVGMIVMALPEIVSFLFKNQQLNTIKEKILNDFVPRLRDQLRPKVAEIFDEQVTALITDISQQFENQISEQKNVIEEREEKRRDEVEKVDEKIAELSKVYQFIIEQSEESGI